MLPLLRTSALGIICLLATAAVASTVYRWVDEQGKVHYSDLVPERYRNTAKPVDAPPAEPTPEQQRAPEFDTKMPILRFWRSRFHVNQRLTHTLAEVR